MTIVVLVSPQMGENIGMAARAMANFGLSTMRIVAPRDGWPNPLAWPASAGSGNILTAAQCYTTLAEAVADCSYIFGTSARSQRRQHLSWHACADACQIISALPSHEQARTAILFGSERSGLTNDDLSLCTGVMEIPTSPSFSSLNLSHAVAVFSYVLSQQNNQEAPAPQSDTNTTEGHKEIRAERSSLERLVYRLTASLDDAGYFRDEQRRDVQLRALRQFWHHYPFRKQEIDAAIGMLRSISQQKRTPPK